MLVWRVVFCLLCLLSTMPLYALAQPSEPDHVAAAILERINAAYAKVQAYQAEVESSEYHKGRLEETRSFRYAFQKPGRLRIDMHHPHAGMQLTYPDARGRVRVRFGGWLGFASLRLQPENRLFATRSGQRIDQSDLGLLIRNIGRSIAEGHSDTLRIEEQPGRVLVEVLAADHFLSGVTTRYRFLIDRVLWLPVAVTESTPQGVMKRTTLFNDLQINPAFPEEYFGTDEKESADAL